ncbi:hypothetical protein C3F09_07125 [candidate division GN15 bacterium]|uniref:Major facilitator superfamily (MFS) profile domain-containing protein n=1 Tax=candidate division GN15 bacterium TaxID=2072418 RepID=A0A855X5D1_9BACT|nr:MAG: hypothetical protein C3F09_07125 [candidate division GN15 bacterium]
MFRRAWHFLKQFDTSLWVLISGWFVAAMGFAASIPFISIYFHAELGLSPSEIGLFFGAQAIVRSIFQAIGGEMSDRISRRWMLIHSQTFRAFSFLMLGVAVQFNWGFWWVSVMFTVQSILGSIFMPAVNALVADLLPPEKRLDGYAVARSATNLGWAVGPAFGGFMAKASYPMLFYFSAILTLGSAVIFRRFLKVPAMAAREDRFHFRDLLAIREDKHIARHAVLTLLLYLVVAQLIAPFSVYTVEMVGISEGQLGLLFTLNGLLVALLQVPVTRMLAHARFTTQLAWGSVLYFIGYGILGFISHFEYFVMAIFIVTLGEAVMSPPGLTLTSRLAPPGRMGRYMGIRGFAETAGWSLGPLYGGLILDNLGHRPEIAWIVISSLALVAGAGYFRFGKTLPHQYNIKE